MMSKSFSSGVEDPESSHVSERDCSDSSVSNHGDIHVYEAPNVSGLLCTRWIFSKSAVIMKA